MTDFSSIERDGYTLQYKIEGSGPTALVIGSALYYSRTFSPSLRNHLKLVFIDHRGFAPDPFFGSEPIHLDTILDDIEYMRTILELTQVIVVGHSGNGYIALEYAKKYPKEVTHLVLIGMGPDQSDASHQAANEYFQEAVCPERKKLLNKNLETLHEKLQAHPETRFITFCLALAPRSWYDYAFDAAPLWQGVQVNMPIIDHLWGIVFKDIDITKGLEAINKPVFLGLGVFDYLVAPFYTWNPLKSKFKNLTIKLFEKSSHTPQYEEPELFDAVLLEWLNDQI